MGITGTTKWGWDDDNHPIKKKTKTEINLIVNKNCKMKNVKCNENFYLVSKEVNNEVTVEVAKQINHVLVVDVSYSMCNELPKIRTQLKNKLSNLMKEGDTISIVWFSGRNDSGILKEEVEVKSLKTLTDLNDAIDRWLSPVGMTAFLKPLKLVGDLIGRIKKNRPNSIFSMLFLTDGYNNDCPWNEVIGELKSLENDIASATFVEYGFYADSRKLTEMASTIGGEKISCNGFDEYEPVFETKLKTTVGGGKKTVVEIKEKYLYDFAFSVTDGSILLYNIVDNKILVGSNVKEIYFFSSNSVGENYGYLTQMDGNIMYDIDGKSNTIIALYAAIYVLSDKLLNEDAEKIFYALGDNYHYGMLANAFGKQKLNAFKTAIKDCVVDTAKQFPSGRGVIKPVSDNAYCFMNLISDLGDIDDCLFYPNHSNFNYNRIATKKVAVGSVLTEADKKRLSEAKNVAEANDILKQIEDSKVDMEFVNTNPDRGYPLTDLVWNSERANLSVRIRIDGEVKLPKNKYGIDKISSYKYNTFTIVKDGILNVTELPVKYSPELIDILNNNNVKYFFDLDNINIVVIDLTSIPVINRGMVKSISAKQLAELEWKLVKLQGDKKVYDYYKNLLFPKTSKSYVELLGQECTDWLKEIGITDYNGFAPKVTSAESSDFYMSVNLATKIKGLSSIPKVLDALAKITAGTPLKLNEWVMADAIKKYLAQKDSDIFQTLSVEQQEIMLKTYLETKSGILNKQRRKALQEIAEIKFALILSKKWFKEFQSFDENKLTLNLDGQVVEFTFDLFESEEKI